MWPLYEEDEQDDQEGTVADDARWRGGASRAYLNEFKDLWSRAHNASLLDLPLMDAMDDVVLRNVKTRLRDEAVGVLEAAVAKAQLASCGEGNITVTSVWDKPLPSKAVATQGNKRHRLVRPRGRKTVGTGSYCEAVLSLDRQDRTKERRAKWRLQQQSRTIIGRLVQDPCIPPHCSVLWADISNTRIFHLSSEQEGCRSKAAQHLSRHQYGEAKSQIPRMIEVPFEARRNSHKFAWGKLALQATEMLESVCAIDTNTTLETDSLNAGGASVFNMVRPLEIRERLPPQPTQFIITPKASPFANTATKTQRHGPKRIKFDGFIESAAIQQPLSAVASSIFKSVMKKNASLVLACSVPETLSNDVRKLLRRANSASRPNQQCDALTCGGTQLLVLPPEIVMYDENRLNESYVVLQRQAQQLGRLLPPSPISLTSLSLAIASIWRHAATQDLVQDYKQTQWALPSACAIDRQEGTSELLDKEPLVCDTETEKLSRSSEPATVNPGEETTGAAIHPSRVIPMTNSATNHSAAVLPLSSKFVTFKVPENVSTDDLVTSFIRIELDEEDLNCEPPLRRAHVPTSAPRESNSDSKFAMTIDQLARPAVWFLVRLKLLKVNSTSILDALKSIHLDVFETITLQLHSKLREISSNPSKLQSEDTIQTCFAFRHAIWLHIIRMIVGCQENSQGMALSTTCRLLGSQNYLLAIGVKQTSALINLYVLMGGSPESTAIQESLRRAGNDLIEEPPLKKPRPDVVQPELSPVRIVCDVRLLEREELFEAMADLMVSVVERELSPVIDMIIDERNAVALLTQEHFSDEQMMKALTYELASSQVQFEKLWIIIDDVKSESALHFFYAALANFEADVQTFVCKGETEMGEIIRGIIDACAETALSQHRILPKMWFARPFVLEEESQLERFLSSTRVMNAFAAQSVLHRLSIEDLTTKSLEEVAHLVGSSLTSSQIDLLWRLLRNSHGVGNDAPICS